MCACLVSAPSNTLTVDPMWWNGIAGKRNVVTSKCVECTKLSCGARCLHLVHGSTPMPYWQTAIITWAMRISKQISVSTSFYVLLTTAYPLQVTRTAGCSMWRRRGSRRFPGSFCWSCRLESESCSSRQVQLLDWRCDFAFVGFMATLWRFAKQQCIAICWILFRPSFPKQQCIVIFIAIHWIQRHNKSVHCYLCMHCYILNPVPPFISMSEYQIQCTMSGMSATYVASVHFPLGFSISRMPTLPLSGTRGVQSRPGCWPLFLDSPTLPQEWKRWS